MVVGASGNVGTGVLRALANQDGVSSVLGLSRRSPERHTAPYDSAEWATVDLTDAGVEDRLTELFTGADAVIHLAWQIQPNTQRERLRLVNVEGTRQVARAVARARVKHLVVASSWAAYSPAVDDQPRDESWTTDGVRSSHYSVDKAAQERVLDEFEREHPEITVARLRQALVFQRQAGAEIVRYFIGPFVPRALLRPGALPILPWPPGLRFQVVHADDAGRAYAHIVRERLAGAFNVAAGPVLTGPDVAKILAHGRVLAAPPGLMRAAMALAWWSRAVPADPGWLDMALGLPLMDASRLRSVGWEPEHSAEDTLLEMVQGVHERAGSDTPVLQPDETSYHKAEGRDEIARSAGPQLQGALSVPEHLDAGLLGLYLADHLTGATAGLNRIQEMTEHYAGTELEQDLGRLRKEIESERSFLIALLASLGLHRRPARQVLARGAERLGRLKLNRRLVHSSPMTPLLELELMRSAVAGKQGGWQVLADYGPDLGLPEEISTELIQRAEEQMRILQLLHQQVRRTALRQDRATEAIQ